MGAKQIIVPPFPPLAWDESSWVGTDVLASWAGFQDRQGAYGAGGGDRPSDGRVRVSVNASAGANGPGPWPEQVVAYQFLKDHEATVATAVLQAVFARYPAMRYSYAFAEDDEEGAALMPPIAKPEDLRTLMGLGTVHVLPVAKAGAAYVGFEFGCTWDDEHGLGVMVHKGRVVDVGGADTSFLGWVAENDGGRKLGE